MEPPQKKHRTTTLAYPPATNQMNPSINTIRPPLQVMKPPIQTKGQMTQTGNPSPFPKNQMYGQPPKIKQHSSKDMGPPDDVRKSKSSTAATGLNQKLLGTSTITPRGGAMSASTADGSVLYLKVFFSVPSDRVGLLIGKGGAKIREIQERSGARMDIAKLSEPATPHLREVRLSGGKEQIAIAREIINKLVTNSASFGLKANSHHASVNPNKTIQIPSTTVGLVIGRGGDNIKKIIQETSCTIHIEKDAEAQKAGRTPPQPGFQNVYLKGTDEAVELAEKAVMELVNGEKNRRNIGYTTPYGQQLGQFIIPYQQYGVPMGAQQIYGLQQPYVIPGQQLTHPTYAMMPGYTTIQQYTPQRFLSPPAYNPGTFGVSPQYVGHPYAQYQAAQVQMGFPQHSHIGAPPTQQPSASVLPQYPQAHALRSTLRPPPQIVGMQGCNRTQPNQSQQVVWSPVYSPGGGGPSCSLKPPETTQTVKSHGLVKTGKPNQFAGWPDLPINGNRNVNLQAAPLSSLYNRVAISAQSTSAQYSSVSTNAQQEFGRTQNHTTAGQNIITGRSN